MLNLMLALYVVVAVVTFVGLYGFGLGQEKSLRTSWGRILLWTGIGLLAVLWPLFLLFVITAILSNEDW